MTLVNLKQVALPVVVLIVVFAGFGAAILLQSEVLLAVIITLPYLIGMWLVRMHHLRLTRRCLATYLQARQS